MTKFTTLVWLLTGVKKPKKAWTDLKKRQRTNTIQILWIAKKIRSAIIACWEAEAAINNDTKHDRKQTPRKLTPLIDCKGFSPGV